MTSPIWNMAFTCGGCNRIIQYSHCYETATQTIHCYHCGCDNKIIQKVTEFYTHISIIPMKSKVEKKD